MTRLRSMIDEPSMFDTLETWEQHLQEVEALPKDDVSRTPMIQHARKVIEMKRQEDDAKPSARPRCSCESWRTDMAMKSATNSASSQKPSPATRQPTSSVSEMLTDSELQLLDRAAKEQIAYGRKAFAHLRPA